MKDETIEYIEYIARYYIELQQKMDQAYEKAMADIRALAIAKINEEQEESIWEGV